MSDSEAEHIGGRFTEALRVGSTYVYKNAPKCGCSTVKRALWWAEIESGRFQGDIDITPSGPTIHAINGLTPWSNAIDDVIDKTVFTFVRNPYERIFSAYRDKCIYAPSAGETLLGLELLGVGQREVTFSDFLAFVRDQDQLQRDPHWRLAYLATVEDLMESHFIGALENMEADMNILFRRCFPDLTPRILVNNSRSHVKAKLPSKHDFEVLAQIYERDFTFYGYSFDPTRSREAPTKTGWRGATG